MIAGSLLLLILPLVLAGVVYILLRWETLSALVAAGGTFSLGMAVITLPLDQPIRLWGQRPIAIAMGETVTILGRELVLEPSDRIAIAMLFFTAAGIFLVAWRMSPRSLLFPIGLGILSLLTGALLIRPAVYAALFIEIAAALSVLILQSESTPSTRGSLRYLTFATLALPGLLVSQWLLERYAFTPDDTGLLSTAGILTILSFALLLGVMPFHTWVLSIIGDSLPLAGAFVLTVNNNVIWFLLLDFLETYPQMFQQVETGSVIITAGLIMVIAGGLLAAAQRRLGLLIGYAILVDNGAMLIALGLNSKVGVMLIFLSILVRPFSLIALASGLSGIQTSNAGNDRQQALRSVGWRALWSMAALLVGGLSIVGFPVSAGFVWRWALYRALVPAHVGLVLLLLGASLAVMSGFWRMIWVLLDRPRSPLNRRVLPIPSAEKGWTVVILAIVILVCLGIGLMPQTVAPLTLDLVESYTFFAQ